jgi:hypothetical protein
VSSSGERRWFDDSEMTWTTVVRTGYFAFKRIIIQDADNRCRLSALELCYANSVLATFRSDIRYAKEYNLLLMLYGDIQSSPGPVLSSFCMVAIVIIN